MATIQEVADVLAQLAPLALAESWDNVGLLVGDPAAPARRVMTCLTITPETAAEAVANRADLVVSHHPLPFRPLKSITAATLPGRLLLQLIGGSVAVYSAHTAFDSARAGINQHWAIGLGLQEIRPLVPLAAADPDEGGGRCGMTGEPLTLRELAERAKTFLGLREVAIVGEDDQPVSRAAIACGSGASFLEAAAAEACEAFVTGEASLHACLEAQARGMGMVLVGHFASERFAMLAMADYLTDQLADVEVWASRSERDPLRNV
jgi:dinuclear metal center YbgI/SA1388 family protein